jgi:hypothetical protein
MSLSEELVLEDKVVNGDEKHGAHVKKLVLIPRLNFNFKVGMNVY